MTTLSRDELLYLVMIAHRAGRMAFVDGQAVAIITPIHTSTAEGMEYACIRIDHVSTMPDLRRVLSTRYESTDAAEAQPVAVPLYSHG